MGSQHHQSTTEDATEITSSLSQVSQPHKSFLPCFSQLVSWYSTLQGVALFVSVQNANTKVLDQVFRKFRLNVILPSNNYFSKILRSVCAGSVRYQHYQARVEFINIGVINWDIGKRAEI